MTITVIDAKPASILDLRPDGRAATATTGARTSNHRYRPTAVPSLLVEGRGSLPPGRVAILVLTAAGVLVGGSGRASSAGEPASTQ